MKLGLFEYQNKLLAGRVEQHDDSSQSKIFVLEPPEQWDTETGLAAFIDQPIKETGETLGLSDVTIQAPIPRPARNVFCVGKNYHDHAHEFASSGFDSSASAGAVPEHPIVFSKVPESVIATEEPVIMNPDISPCIDYEAELAVIIGKKGKNIAEKDALDYVWGYTIINDVTARDLQGQHSQWLIGKSQDTFCPMGPFLVTKEEIDLGNTGISCHINGELRQESNTKHLIFDVPTTIAAISNGITLKPGDVIATGTPAGVGIGFKPPRYMQDGEVMEVAIEGIGVLRNTVMESNSA